MECHFVLPLIGDENRLAFGALHLKVYLGEARLAEEHEGAPTPGILATKRWNAEIRAVPFSRAAHAHYDVTASGTME